MAGAPFDDIKALIAGLPEAPQARFAADPMLGRLGVLASWLSRWSEGRPRILRPVVALYAGAYDAVEGDLLRARLEAVAAGVGAVNALAQGVGAGLEAFDLAVDRPVADMTAGAAMSERECAATMAFGMEALAKQPDLLILGSIAVGDEAACAAVALDLFGGAPEQWSEHAAHRAAQARVRARAEIEGGSAPLQTLRQLGGREIAAMAGAILAARQQGVPVLLDGYGAAAAAAVLHAVDPRAIAHVMAGDVSPAPGHARLLTQLDLQPLIDMRIGAGEGCGGLAALGVLRAACDLT
jgi:nicotinate-nucleotide--dimethylbenzimidazole phosphoribosyltransferase